MFGRVEPFALGGPVGERANGDVELSGGRAETNFKGKHFDGFTIGNGARSWHGMYWYRVRIGLSSCRKGLQNWNWL